jgi:hypothetical protein
VAHAVSTESKERKNIFSYYLIYGSTQKINLKRRLPLLDAINLKKDGDVNINLLYCDHNLSAIFINQDKDPHKILLKI